MRVTILAKVADIVIKWQTSQILQLEINQIKCQFP